MSKSSKERRQERDEAPRYERVDFDSLNDAEVREVVKLLLEYTGQSLYKEYGHTLVLGSL